MFGGDAQAGHPSRPGAAYVVAYYRSRVAHVLVTGTRYDGVAEPADGSGFLIGDTLVVTASHVIPRLADYQTTEITVSLKDQPGPIPAHLRLRDPDSDLAILELTARPAMLRPACPVEAVVAADDVPLGSGVTVLSYPLGYDLGPTGGILGPRDPQGRWRTDAALDPGSSGAPVFLTDEGYLLGIAVGGVRWTERAGRMLPVTAVNQFLPASALVKGSLRGLIEHDSACWQAAQAPQLDLGEKVALMIDKPEGGRRKSFWGLFSAFAPMAFSAPPRPESVAPLDLTTYVPLDAPSAQTAPGQAVTLQAEAGYSILRCLPRPRAASETAAVECAVEPNGRAAKVVYRSDAPSGFWAGMVILQQRRSEAVR